MSIPPWQWAFLDNNSVVVYVANMDSLALAYHNKLLYVIVH